MQAMDRTARTNNFDLVRLFGAILVIYGHSYALTGRPIPAFAMNGVATIGVKIFFVISGYLVALSWLRDPNVARFFWRRSLRIFPALIVVVLLTTFVMGPLLSRLSLWQYLTNLNTYRYLQNIVLYNNYYLPGLFEKNVYPNAINGSLWTLSAEFAMYLLTPILIVGAGLIKPRIAFAVIAAIFVVTCFWLTLITPPTGQLVIYATDVWSCLFVVPYFVVGMTFAVCRLERALNIYIAFAALFMLAVFETSIPVKEAALLIVLPYVCLSFGIGYAPPMHRLTRGTDLSYGLYLYAFPVQQIISLAFGAQIGPWLHFLLATIICAGLAALSWHFVEKPALSWKPQVNIREPANSARSRDDLTLAEHT